jgi:hypothetical protein
MKRNLILAIFTVSWAAAGCGPVITGPAVKVIPTRTPGVSYVVVRPAFEKRTTTERPDGTGEKVWAVSEYLLLCDARPATGMVCTRPPEVSAARVSLDPPGDKTTTPVEFGVGVLADISIKSLLKTIGEEPGEKPLGEAPVTPEPVQPEPATQPEGGVQ